MSTLRWTLLAIGAVILLLIYYFDRRSRAGRSRDIFGGNPAPEADILLDDSAEKELEEQFQIPRQHALRDFENQELDTLAEELSERIEPTLPGQSDSEDTSDDSLNLAADVDAGVGEPAETDTGELDKPIQGEAADDDTPVEEESMVIVMYVVAPTDKPFNGKAVLKAFHAHKLRFGELNVFHRIAGAGAAAHTVFSISNMLNPGTLIPDEIEHADIKGLSLFMKLPGPADPSGGYDDMLHCAKHLAATLEGVLKDETLTELTQEKIAQQRKQMKRAFA